MDFKPESLVSPVASLLGVILADGRHASAESLGVGVVKGVAADSQVLVHWTRADADALMDPADLDPLGPEAHLVMVLRFDSRGVHASTRPKIITSPGLLEHNWRVELRPKNIVRTIRPDGSAWTFDWNPTLGRIYPRFTIDFPPQRPDDAEALTVAELAVY